MKYYIKVAIFAVFLASMVPATGLATATVSSVWPASNEGINIDDGLGRAIYGVEPSGLYWDSGNSRLLGVGDEGDVFAIDLNNTSKVKIWWFGGDLEGITMVGSDTYLLDEDGKIYKVDLSGSGKVLQTWEIGAFVPETGGWAGGEGLVYAEISGNWYFLVSSQDGGVIHVLDLSSCTAEEKGTFTSGSGRTDASDMYYENGLLYVLYDSNRAVEVLKLEGTAGSVQSRVVYEYTSTPEADAEGFALAPSSGPTRTVYLAYDTGSVISYSNFPNLSYEEDTNGDATTDDEVVTEEEPAIDYHSLDPSTDYREIITGYWGEKNGDYSIEYADGSQETYSAFSISTHKVSRVSSIFNSGYFLVTNNKNFAVVNAYSGEVIATTKLTKVNDRLIKKWLKTVPISLYRAE